MELCNDIDANPPPRPCLPLPAVQGGAANAASICIAALANADASTAFKQQYWRANFY